MFRLFSLGEMVTLRNEKLESLFLFFKDRVEIIPVFFLSSVGSSKFSNLSSTEELFKIFPFLSHRITTVLN